MTKELKQTSAAIIALYQTTVKELEGKPETELEELMREANAEQHSAQWSIRTGATIIQTAITMIREHRRK